MDFKILALTIFCENNVAKYPSKSAKEFKQLLISHSDAEKAKILQRFFKTQEGEYGYGDKFLGVKVPQIRLLVKENPITELSEIQKLLQDEIHECRSAALIHLERLFSNSKRNEKLQKTIFDFYLKHTKYINNWDLVDISAPKIVGKYLFDKSKQQLFDLATNGDLWQKRIAIISTLYFIKKGELDTTFQLAEILINSQEDLMQKAVGWMLREAGKINHEREVEFLLANDRYKKMPRTMLRYAIEKFDENLRQSFLKGTI